MKDQLLAHGKRLWAGFRAFSPGQKAVTIIVGAAVLIAVIVFATYKSPTPYSPLFTNLAPSDASAIVDKLNSDGISYKLGQDGTEILVPQADVYSERISLSAAGLPSSDQTGYALLDKEGVTTSQFKQQIDYQRAIEGEMDKTIEAMNGIQSASVHLAIPQQDVFNDGTQDPTAAVMLTLTNGLQLTTQQVQSIVYLVSSSVPSMKPNDVTVTDSAGDVLSAPGAGVTAMAGTATQTQATQQYDTSLSTSLQNMIDQVVGSGHAVVTVNAQLNFNKTNTTSKSYTYTKGTPPVSESKSVEKYTGSQANAGGVLGAVGSTGGTTTTCVDTTVAGCSATGGGVYSKVDETVNNALGTVTQTTQNAPGQVQKLSIAVLLDKSSKNANVSAIKSLVSSAVGLNTTRGDTLSIQALPFDQSAAAAAAQQQAAAAAAAAKAKAHQRLVSYIKQGALALGALLILFGVWFTNRRRRKVNTAPDVTTSRLDVTVADDAPGDLREQAEAALDKRRALVGLAERQPADVAGVLSDWMRKDGPR